MLADITPERMANAICQDTSFSGKYILVEGNNDYILYKKFFDNVAATIQNAQGKQNISDVCDIVVGRGFKNVVGIIDADFKNLTSSVDSRSYIFYTDDHDLETMIITSNAFDSIIDMHCDENRLKDFLVKENHSHLRDVLFDRCAHLGYLKWANNIKNWGLKFNPTSPEGSQLKIEDFIVKNTLKFTDYQTMIKTVFNYTREKVPRGLKQSDVIDFSKTLARTTVNFNQLCNGHDIVYIFALSLKKATSNLNSNAVPPAQIENELVLAYEARHFANTELYFNLKKYEASESCVLLNC